MSSLNEHRSCEILWKGIVVCILILMYGCNEPDPLDFPGVTTEVIELDYNIGTVRLKGRVDGMDVSTLLRRGFYWSNSYDSLLIGQSKSKIDSMVLTQDTFSVLLENLLLDQTYYYQAFAEFSNENIPETRKVLGSIKTFSFDITLLVKDTVIAVNDQAILSGTVSGIDQLQRNLQHGYIFSKSEPVPTLGQVETFVLPMGPINLESNLPDTLITNLDLLSTYYYRAWIQTDDTIYYSRNTGVIITKDGWKRITPFQFPVQKASAVTVGNSAYVFMGCKEQCSSGFNDIYVNYNLTQEWQSLNKAIPNLMVNGISFAIGQNIYYGFGELRVGQVPWGDFYKLNVNQGEWETVNTGNVSARTDAVAFTIHNKAYIGLGRLGDTLLKDFYEFDPTTEQFVELEDLQVMLPNGLADFGRKDAVAFQIDDVGYVLGGVTEGGQEARDLWKFIPPDTSNEFMSNWEFIGFFPGSGRSEAVAFTVNHSAYIVTGYSQYDGYLNDVWEFTPPDQFKQVTSFPGGARDYAIGFSLPNDRGYLGTGRNSSGTYKDLWEYTPNNK